jgi:4-hydroxy-tetrahydrodipicolinate reductase
MWGKRRVPMINVAVTGSAGRMGKMMILAVTDDPDLTLSGAIETGVHSDIGHDAGICAGVSDLGVKITDDIETALDNADVLIDFSTPKGAMAALSVCVKMGVPAVTGTTGQDDDGVSKIKKYSEKIPIVMAPNMSVGVNLLFKLSGEVAEILGDDFDIEIVEAHHNKKVDAPSGTAKRLFEIIASSLKRDPRDVGVYGREGNVGARTEKEIGVFAVRAGDIVGEHTVIFGGTGERIELTHKAHSRMTFVKGAVRAAKWIVKKGPGLYDMQDVLGLKS